jgi:ethanolamine transporter
MVSTVIIWIMMILMAAGGISYFIANAKGKEVFLSEKFKDGFNAMGALTMSMAGAVCIAPVLGKGLEPVLGPIFEVFGASPAMAATMILACDMGGWPLAGQLAGVDNSSPEAVAALMQQLAAGTLDPAMAAKVNVMNFSGLMLGSMMGATIVFSIPVGLGIIPVEDRKFLGQGILIGLITIPIGCFVGGAVAGYNPLWMIQNLAPVIIFAVIIAVCLAIFPKRMIEIFKWFGYFIVAFLTICLVIAGFQQNTGVIIIEGMDTLANAFNTVGLIAVTLAGAFGLVYLLTKYLGGPLGKIGKLLGMNDTSAAGMVATLANNIAMFNILKDMDDRGKVINVAFAVSAAFVFGDHLGFVAGVNAAMIGPVIVGKLVGGITAVIIAYIVTKPKAAKA